MNHHEQAALKVAVAIGQVGRALAEINERFAPEDIQRFSALLSLPATQEQFCLPAPSDAIVVCSKNLRGIARDWPNLTTEIDRILSDLRQPSPAVSF